MLNLQHCCCDEVCGILEVFYCPPQFLGKIHHLWPVCLSHVFVGWAGLEEVVDVLNTSVAWALVSMRPPNSVEMGKQATVSSPESEYGDLLYTRESCSAVSLIFNE